MKADWYNNFIFNKKVSSRKGIGVVEIVFASSIIAIVFTGVFSAISFYIKIGFSNVEKVEAIYLAEEGLEVVKHLRDGSWSSNIAALSTNSPYYLFFEPTLALWQTTTNEILIGDLKRIIVLSDVYRRDSDNDIIPESSLEAKTLDLNTKKASVFVYKILPESDKELVNMDLYISNIFGN